MTMDFRCVKCPEQTWSVALALVGELLLAIAGFAFYMWYRLARDAWEKEVEALSDDGEGAEQPLPRP